MRADAESLRCLEHWKSRLFIVKLGARSCSSGLSFWPLGRRTFRTRMPASPHLSPTPLFRIPKRDSSISERGTSGCSSHHSASPCMPFFVNSAFKNDCLSESPAPEDERERMIWTIPLVAAAWIRRQISAMEAGAFELIRRTRAPDGSFSTRSKKTEIAALSRLPWVDSLLTAALPL